MDSRYNKDEAILLTRRFYMHKKCSPVLKQIYALLCVTKDKATRSLLDTLRKWLLVPFSLWPYDVRGAGELACAELQAGRPIDREMAALLEFVQPIPSREEQDAIAAYEIEVELGNYDELVRNDVKYQVRMKELEESLRFRAHFKLLQVLFNLDEIANGSPVLRRMMACERNFRIKDFLFNWADRKSRFLNVFTAFCWHHELYGLEKKDGKWVPLLMKVTVNVTPQGLIIYVPKWMSLDLKRDLIIKAVTELHKTRGNLRQGAKISESRLEKQDLAKAVYRADSAAKDKKMKGKERFKFIISETGLPRNCDERRIRELIQQGAEVVAAEQQLEAIAAIANLPAARDTAPTALELAQRAFEKLTPEDKDQFRKAMAV